MTAESMRRWREANPEKARQYARDYYKQNREKINAQKRGNRGRRVAPTPEQREAKAELNRKWRAANPERKREYERQYRQANRDVETKRLHRYRGRDAELWAAMWERQGGCCYLCERPLPSDARKVAVDHDHRCCERGTSCPYCQRGLACSPCNTLIGMAGDDPDRLRRIADNLQVALASVTERLASKPEQLMLG